MICQTGTLMPHGNQAAVMSRHAGSLIEHANDSSWHQSTGMEIWLSGLQLLQPKRSTEAHIMVCCASVHKHELEQNRPSKLGCRACFKHLACTHNVFAKSETLCH